jgi:hypothetical protein
VCSDFYCDANSICGESCAEIDIQEGNKHSWHSTLHGKADYGGFGKGVGGGGPGWSGPREWSTFQYGPGASCIDTSKPFQVEVGFPADPSCQLLAMEVTLSQGAQSPCQLKLAIDSYERMPELSAALAAGMTPIVSYWNSVDMLWLDGKGVDGPGPCAIDSPDDCGKRTTFSNFSVAAIPGSTCMAKLINQPQAEVDGSKTDAHAKDYTVTTAESLVASEDVAANGNSGVQVPLQLLVPLDFSAGAMSTMLIVCLMGFICSRQTQQIPVLPEQGTTHSSLVSSTPFVTVSGTVWL